MATAPADSERLVPVLDRRLVLSESVALRAEPFGALAYHFGNRRLTFLKRQELVDVVQSLDGDRTVAQCLALAGVPERHWAAFGAAIAGLQEADMVHDIAEQS